MLIGREVRRRALELERAQRGGGEVQRGFGVAASPQRVERPDHAGRTNVEVLQRQRFLPPFPFVRGPEPLRIERRVGVGDDRRDRVLNARRGPRLVSQPLKLSWVVQHAATLTRTAALGQVLAWSNSLEPQVTSCINGPDGVA